MARQTNRLAERLRSGNYSPADFELALNTVEQREVPIGELRRQRDTFILRYAQTVHAGVRDMRELTRRMYRDLSKYWKAWTKDDQHKIWLPDYLEGDPVALLWYAFDRLSRLPSYGSLRSLLTLARNSGEI
jgi:hypothetical protein